MVPFLLLFMGELCVEPVARINPIYETNCYYKKL